MTNERDQRRQEFCHRDVRLSSLASVQELGRHKTDFTKPRTTFRKNPPSHLRTTTLPRKTVPRRVTHDHQLPSLGSQENGADSITEL